MPTYNSHNIDEGVSERKTCKQTAVHHSTVADANKLQCTTVLWQSATHFILNVWHPTAFANNWWPRQIPKIGLWSFCIMIFLMLLIVSPQIAGSPGPLLRNSPSNSSGFRTWFQGTTSSLTLLFKKQRSWLYFRPQSTTHIRGNPLALYTTGACKITDKVYSNTHTLTRLVHISYLSMHYFLKAASCSATQAISQLQEVFTAIH